MATEVVTTLSESEIALAQQKANEIASSITTPVVQDNQFVFFAAFDGTNNNGNKPPTDPQSTNVWQLYKQMQKTENIDSKYYPGPGTEGTLTASSWLPPQVTQQVINTANQAYNDFARQASEWLDTHPGGSVTTMVTAFSRGSASAAIFSQLLFEKGLVDPRTNEVLILPGEVGVSGGVIFDPVVTGVSGNLAFVNVENLAVIRAQDEQRSLFQAADYTGQAGISTYYFAGNHCDIGGGVDNGLPALTLEAATSYFSDLGLSIAGVPESRQFDASSPVTVHIESGWAQDNVDANGTVIPNFTRLTDTVSIPEYTSLDGGKTRVYENIYGNEVTIAKIELIDGYSVLVSVRDKEGALVSQTTEKISLDKRISFIDIDSNGDGVIDRTSSFTTNDDGTKTTNINIYASNGDTTEIVRHLDSDGTLNDEVATTVTASGNVLMTVTNVGYSGAISTQYNNGVFVGFSSINGASVSSGFNEQFLQELKNQDIKTPTIEDINRLSENLGENTSATDIAIKEAYDTTVESSVSVTDYYGTPKLITQTEATLQTIGTGIASLTDALSLIKAIQSGQPLPIAVTGIRLAADLDYIDGVRDMPNLAAASSIASGILSIMSLSHALENGDSIGAVTAGANALYFTASGYAVLSSSSTEVAKALSSTFETTGGALNSLGEALPYLNIVNSIAHGDAVGVGVAVVDMAMINASMYSVPYIGWAYAVYSIIDSLFGGDEIPDPWGNGKYVWDGNGISYQSAGETGGNEAVRNVMSNVLAVLNNLIEQQRLTNPTSALGIIPNRMPTIAYDMSGYRYTDIDPLTGVEKHAYLRYDTQGNPYNATPGSDESYQSIIEAMVRSALTRSAIAPLWEVQTAKMQTDAGDPKAGLTEEARAGRDGALASAISGATQTFRPVTLDLSGNGQIDILSKESANVNFDVDDSGFLKDTAWIDCCDANCDTVSIGLLLSRIKQRKFLFTCKSFPLQKALHVKNEMVA